MNISHLSRPSILCQCFRCSSSVAACENEWAKLSDTYSTVTGWISIDLNRLSISSEKKQIPGSSELEFVRGRVVQDIVCRLCQKKLGGLVHLETEPKVFWKLSKVSFREIISMKESQPKFIEGSISWLLAPTEQSATELEATSNPSASSGRSEAVLSQTLYNQGASLNKISSSVEELQDTMSDLKQSFKALRLELNTSPSIRSQDHQADETTEMLRIVLRELQSKSDEIEKLKLENESLKLKNKVIQERRISTTPLPERVLEERSIPEVQSPGFLTERWRGDLLVAALPGPTIADSFEEDIEIMDHATTDGAAMPVAPVKIPLKPAADVPPSPPRLTEPELDSGIGFASLSRRNSGEPATKRRRLATAENTEITNRGSASTANQPTAPEKKKRGRQRGWRRSQSGLPSEQPHTPEPRISLPEDPLLDTNTNPIGDSEALSMEVQATQPTSTDAANTLENIEPRGTRRRGRSKASPTRSTSATTKVASRTRRATKSQERSKFPQKQRGVLGQSSEFEVTVNVAELTPESVVNESELVTQKKGGNQRSQSEADDLLRQHQHQAKIAARDALAKAAMEREEAMAEE